MSIIAMESGTEILKVLQNNLKTLLEREYEERIEKKVAISEQCTCSLSFLLPEKHQMDFISLLRSKSNKKLFSEFSVQSNLMFETKENKYNVDVLYQCYQYRKRGGSAVPSKFLSDDALYSAFWCCGHGAK